MMSDTFFTVWLIGSACMTLDFFRLYCKAIRDCRDAKQTLLRILADIEMRYAEKPSKVQLSELAKNLEKDFDDEIRYVQNFLVGAITMCLFWPIALLNLMFAEKTYENTMIGSFGKPFRIMLLNLYGEIQTQLALDFTTELLEKVISESVQAATERKEE